MAAAQGGEDVYASLLLTDTYLPGALVLAHSLRDAGTKKKLAILVTLDSVSAEVVSQLKAVYDYVIPVSRIRNARPANLYLMNRPDLHSAFTKIALWKQTQFRKIVYLDADVVAYRAPDELFDLPHAFSAAPDIGWPDLFNTGVMALTPNMGDYYAMMAMAERGISFDGADQGLLNMHFKNTFNRLSFTYNVTPSAHYQYVPAYKHFQSSINLVHFIGSEKPWLQGRDKSTGDSPFDEIAGRWWAVYDRHYRVQTSNLPVYSSEAAASTVQAAPLPALVQYFVKGEYQPVVRYVVSVGGAPGIGSSASDGQQYQAPAPSHVEQSFYHHDQPQIAAQSEHKHHDHHDFQPHHHHHHYHYQHHHQHENQQHHDQKHSDHVGHGHEEYRDQQRDPPSTHHDNHEQFGPGSPSQQSAQHPPPSPSVSLQSETGAHTEARAVQAPEHHYETSQSAMSQSESKPEPYQAPPTQSWDAQRQPPPSDSKPEALDFPKTQYAMSSDPTPFVPPERYPSPPKDMWYEVPKERPPPAHEPPKAIFPWETRMPPPSRVFTEQPESPVTETPAASFSDGKVSTESQAQAEPSMIGSPTESRSEPPTPLTPVGRSPANPWDSFQRTNAWDDVPGINRYVDAISNHRRTRSQGLGKTVPELRLKESSWAWKGSRVTDFPSEDDRPSLPVTPAPIRRARFWGGGAPGLGLDDEEDEGRLPVAEGVPVQSDWDPLVQLQKLARQHSDVLLKRLSGSATIGDDTIGIEGREIPSRPLPFGSENLKSPTYVAYSPAEVVSPKPVKPDSGTSPVQNILDTGFEDSRPTASSSGIEAPSYQGPGVVFEKGEGVPLPEGTVPHTEEERDETYDGFVV